MIFYKKWQRNLLRNLATRPLMFYSAGGGPLP